MSRCPNDVWVVLWLMGELPEEQQAQVESHVSTCTRCETELAELRGTLTSIRADSGGPTQASPGCLSEADLAGWVDGTLDEGARASTLVHLSNCPRCVRSLSALVSALNSQPVAAAIEEAEAAHTGSVSKPALSRRLVIAAGVAAASIVGLVAVRWIALDVEQESVHRGSTESAAAAPELRSPVGQVGVVSEFSWTPVRGSDTYRITLYDAHGTVVWETETDEPRIALPDTIEIARDVQYLWKIAARLQLGRWVSSELAGFSISEP